MNDLADYNFAPLIALDDLLGLIYCVTCGTVLMNVNEFASNHYDACRAARPTP